MFLAKMAKINPNGRNGRWLALGQTCLAVGLVLGVIFATGWRKEQAKFGDFLVDLAPGPVLPIGVALVGIDASSLTLDQLSPEEIAASPSFQAMKKGYPWSRAVYAEAIVRLMQAGARLVLVDVLMPGPREGDEALHKVLEKYGDRVVLVSTFAEDVSGAGQNIARYQPPWEALIASTKTNVGHASFWGDDDQVVRLAPFRLKRPGTGEMIPSAASVMLGLLAGKEKQAGLPEEAAFIPGKKVSQETMRPLWQIFHPITWRKNLKDGEVFRDKIVAIGSYYTSAHDVFQTAVDQRSGVEIHLATLAAAWQGAFYSMPGGVARGLAAFLASLAAWLVAVLLRNIVFRCLACAAGIVLILAGGVGALVWLHVQIPLLPLLSGFLTGSVGALIVDLVAEGKARHRARRMIERYFSPGLVRELLDRRDSVLESLGGSHREVTVLFADLRGFTTHAESVDPATLLAELNDYLGRMTAIIFEAGGGVDKFLGDGILAVWGTLEDSSAAPALACSEKMLAELRVLNATRTAQGKPEWNLGIGIHKGPVLFGNVGSHKRMELTVIGDTVNLASRTEGLNKAYGTGILFTRSVRDDAEPDVSGLRSVDRIRVVGRSQSVDLFTFWHAAIPTEDRLAYERAVADYRAGEFSRAASVFQTLQASRPDDTLYSVYAERCLEWLASPPQEPWQGISHARSK